MDTSLCMYTQTLHSRRTGHIRLDERNSEIRKSNLTQGMQRRLGVRAANHQESMSLPMVRFSHMIREKKNMIPRTSFGKKVVSSSFDSNLNVPPVPDHCLTGVIKNLLEVWFAHMNSDVERKACEIRLIYTLSQNGLPAVSNVLKWDKHRNFVSVENISMSSLFCVLFVCSNCFTCDPLYKTDHMTPLFVYLETLVSTLYSFPYPMECSPSIQKKLLGEYHGRLFLRCV